MNTSNLTKPVADAADARTCGDESVDAGRGPGQIPWYRYVAEQRAGTSILDAGCGLGFGLQVLRDAGCDATGQDVDPRLESEHVRISPLSAFAAKSVDTVIAIDVIEHVEDPEEFLASMARIARRDLFLTTPNWTAGKCTWPYHLREYTPKQWDDLLSPFGDVELLKGNQEGSVRWPVKRRGFYFAFNDVRVLPVLAFPARCWNNVIPRPWRLYGHNAAWVKLS